MNASAIDLRHVCKRFGGVAAAESVTLQVEAGEFFSLVGPSGCGKTTLLRLIAGFEQPDSGELRIGGAAMNGVPPQARPVNTVFQNYALFPHLTVFENVAFGLRVRKTPPPELRRRVLETLELLHVAELRDRRPSEISGGQRQRVALARALAVRPKVLLLDEPLAAVDAQRRAQVQEDLKELQRQSQTTFLYVTHDQDEALALGDRLAVMQAGQIAQIGTPGEVYERPRTRFVASFLGRCNLFDGASLGAGRVRLELGEFRAAVDSPAGADVTVGIRPERVALNPDQTDNTVLAEISSTSYTGAAIEYSLRAKGASFRALAPSSVRFLPGEQVRAHFPPDAIFLLDPQ